MSWFSLGLGPQHVLSGYTGPRGLTFENGGFDISRVTKQSIFYLKASGDVLFHVESKELEREVYKLTSVSTQTHTHCASQLVILLTMFSSPSQASQQEEPSKFSCSTSLLSLTCIAVTSLRTSNDLQNKEIFPIQHAINPITPTPHHSLPSLSLLPLSQPPQADLFLLLPKIPTVPPIGIIPIINRLSVGGGCT